MCNNSLFDPAVAGLVNRADNERGSNLVPKLRILVRSTSSLKLKVQSEKLKGAYQKNHFELCILHFELLALRARVVGERSQQQ